MKNDKGSDPTEQSMSYLKFYGAAVALVLLTTPARSSDDWKLSAACVSAFECTALEHCWGDWDPVNRVAMPFKAVVMVFGDPSCNNAVLTPKPVTRCIHHQCMNDPSLVEHWMGLGDDYKESLIARRLVACFTQNNFKGAALMQPLIKSYRPKIDEAIREGRYSSDTLISQMLKDAMPCDVVAPNPASPHGM
jgi:hypothetical protein